MPTQAGLVGFDSPRLAEDVEKLSPDQIDALPFGAIRLDRDGNITFFSARERQQSGYRHEALSRSFFADVAPCLDTPQYRGQLEKALRDGGLDVEFADIVDLPDGRRDVEVRVRMQSGPSGANWIFTQRPG
jgi:photoactive yellow protein